MQSKIQSTSEITDKLSAQDHKWRTILLLSLAILLCMGVWFSASAVIPALTVQWSLSEAGRAWLTISVQLGFVTGALGSAILNLADRIPSRKMLTFSAFMAALMTALIPLAANGLGLTLILRFLTGLFVAGIYPVGMKIAATWTRRNRGLAIGLLTGALVVGTASPHLINAFSSFQNWQQVLYIAAISSISGGVINWFYVNEGPYRTSSPRFNWKYVGELFRERSILLANLGYLGHMWELFAMWAWLPLFLVESFSLRGIAPTWASLAAFFIIAIGGLGSLLFGMWADRWGRTRLITIALSISGTCCLIVGFLFGGNTYLIFLLSLIWGFTVVSDSGQLSTSISELCEPKYIGTALTVQTSLGFLLTVVTIRLVPTLVGFVGWGWAFTILALGPAIGIWTMIILRRLPESHKLAGGKR